MKNDISEEIVVIDELTERKNLEKYTSFYFLMNRWMKLLEKGISISTYFTENNYSQIAIYGNGEIGKHLITQLEKDKKNILCIINRTNVFYKNNTYKISDDIVSLIKPDIIVVTPIMEYFSIKSELEFFFNTKIVSIEEIILNL